MKRILFFLFLISSILSAQAQVTVRGEVVDSASHAPLQGASVSLRRGGKTLKFTRTNDKGRFEITVDAVQEGDMVQATLMGYKKQSTIATAENIRLYMPSTAFVLREVQVKGARVHGRDTITYDLTQFANDRDNSLKDVLKKLPGVDVADNGKISYNGKDIHRFTVEGLDLTNGRYNQLTENIRAKDVKKAEIVEHDQPIKALQDKTWTDDVGMNVQLKDEARDRLTLTLRPYVLLGQEKDGDDAEVKVGGSANLMQIGKKKQRMYDAAYDNSGRRISGSSDLLATFYSGERPMSLPTWHSQMSLDAPLDAQRLRFNDAQHYAVNDLRKGKNDAEWRVNARYDRSRITQNTENVSLYNITDGVPVETRQDRSMDVTTDNLALELEHKVNTKTSYGNEKLQIGASRGDGMAHYGNDLWQRLRTPQIDGSLSAYRMVPLKRWQLWWKGVVDYHNGEDKLDIIAETAKLNSSLFHTAHSLELMTKRGFYTQNYDFGVSGYWLKTEQENSGHISSISLVEPISQNSNHYKARFSPSLSYRRDKWRWNIALGTTLEHFTSKDKTWLRFDPRASLRYTPGTRNEYSLNVNYSESAGAITNYAIGSYRRNYRTMWHAADFIPVTRMVLGSLRWSYKRPIYEFFASANASYNHLWLNSRTDMQITSDGNYIYTLLKENSESDSWTASGSMSKGFYKLHLKAMLDASASFSSGSQRSADKVFDYTGRTLSVTPGLEWAPSWAAFSYSARFTQHKSHTEGREATELLNIRQELSATATIRRVDLTYSLVAHHNELQEGNAINVVLSDATLTWRLKKLRLTATLSNIFNKRQYIETIYNGISTSTTIYHLRPRELKLSAQYTL